LTREPTKTATSFAVKRNSVAEASRRNSEVVQAMGMGPRMAAVWNEVNGKYLDSQQRAADVAGGFGAMSKVMRMAFQSAVLGVGALLVISQEATAGIIIAGSILAGRALAPVDLAIANWRNFVAFRQSWRRLNELLTQIPAEQEVMQLPKPANLLAVENISLVPPGDKRIVVQEVAFRLQKGSGLGIIGPSASGKSSVARSLVGIWRPVRGTVRLDGAALDQWTPTALGQHIGYLPQDVELLAGNVAQNISRFAANPDAGLVLEAAKAAGVHDLILRLPEGYKTEIGEGGTQLSAGQCQRLALARALYGDPFLVVLDEPNSNLDAEGEEALTQAILSVRSRGGVVVVVAHRPSALAGVDQVMVMAQGKCQMVGPKEEVLAKMTRRPTPPAVAVAGGGLRVVAEPGASAGGGGAAS
jgi:PrtD family type I secretion system ABC transporter